MNITKSTPLFTGFFIAIMVTVNTNLSQSIGKSYSVFIIHLTGLAILLGSLAVSKNRVKFTRELPLWLYMGGGLGIFVVLFNNLTIQNIGVSLALSLGIAGQIITSIFLEHIGFMGTIKKRFTPIMLPGILLILIGSILIVI